MRQFAVAHVVLTMCGSVALAADMNVSVTRDGAGAVCVAPASTVRYDVTGVLSDTGNEGLAGVLFNLTFSGGALEPADSPSAGPMASFVMPVGLANPEGYGGTVINGALVQVGGLQNTINNAPGTAPFPIGEVATGVAHGPVVLVSGTLIVPTLPGTYTLSLSDLVARVIRSGADGVPAWLTEAAGSGSISNLTIHVGEPGSDGDFDGNGQVDLSDFAEFQDCGTGPGLGPVECDCDAGDFDGDTDLDLADFGAFQIAFGS